MSDRPSDGGRELPFLTLQSRIYNNSCLIKSRRVYEHIHGVFSSRATSSKLRAGLNLKYCWDWAWDKYFPITLYPRTVAASQSSWGPRTE